MGRSCISSGVLVARGAIAILALGLATPRAARAQSGVSDDRVAVPDGPGSVEGLGDNATLDRNMGLMAYGVPFELPKGFAQATPTLGLTYSTGTGNSIVGIGWALNVPSIERLTLRGLPGYTADDELAADGGTQLVRVATGAGSATYRARHEGGFVRYTWHDAGAAGYFTAEYPDGSVGYFGATAAGVLVPEARLAGADGATFRYHLVDKVDAHAHRVHYGYQLVDGAPYLMEIGYVHDDAGRPRYTVRLGYATRADAISDGKPGFDHLTTRRLATVTIAVAGETLRRYALTYDTQPGGLSRLARVEQFGRAGTRYPVVFAFGYSRALGGVCAGGACEGPFVVHMGTLPTGSAMRSGTATLVDINGDALPDVLDTSIDGAHAFVLNRLDAGGGSSFDPIVRHSAIGTRSGFAVERPTVQELDVNGDGLTDLLNVAQQTVLCNDASGDWTLTGCQNDGNLGISLAGGGGDPAGVRFLDVDGDRRIDVLQTVSADGVLVRRNTGTSFETVAGAAPIGVAFDQARLFFADINGDGLLDPVHFFETGAIRYREHLGRARWGAWIDLPAPPLSTAQLGAVALEDLNGDGLDDLVIVEPSAVSYALNRGATAFDPTFTRITTAAVPGLPTRSIDTTVLFADMNANGSLDIVWIQLDGSTDYLELFPVQPNLLSRIENGLGMVQEITYGTAAAQRRVDPAAWTHPLTTPASVVTRVDTWTTLTGGEAGQGLHELVEYRYADGFYDGREKEFRGFARVVATTVADRQDGQEPGRTEETYDLGAIDTYRKGRLLASARFTGDAGAARPLDETRVRYDDCALTGVPTSGLRLPVRHVCEVERTTIVKEGAPTDQWATVRTASAYDGYGRVTLASNFGVINRGSIDAPQACAPCGGEAAMCGASCTGDEAFTATDYVDPATGTGGRWRLDLASRVRTSAAPGGAFAQTETYYDGAAFVGLAAGQATRGDVTRVHALETATAGIDTQRARYDLDGNAIEVLDPDGAPDSPGHRRSYAYDTTGLRVVRTDLHLADPAGTPYVLRREYSYDPAFDKVAEATGWMTVGGAAPASARKATGARYDEFGRRIAILQPGDPEGAPTLEYEWVLGNPASRIIERKRSTRGAAADLERVKCVDGRGRTYQERTRIAGDLYQISGFNAFNSRGAPVRIYQPYLRQGGFCDTAEPTGVLVEQVRYDVDHREIHRTYPPADAEGPSERATVFGPLSTASHDEDDLDPASPLANTPTLTWRDGLGRTVAIERTLTAGATGPTTRARYDELGRLAAVIDPAGGTKTQTYDLLGRVVQVVDPSSGTTTFAYDDAGNLVSRVDARGVTTQTRYDGANRPVAVWDPADPDGTTVRTIYDFGGSCAASDCANAEGQAIEIAYPLDPVLVARLGGDATGVDHMGFDTRGQRVYEDRAIGRARLVTRRVFDNAGRVVTRVHPDGRRLDTAYDGASRLIGIGGVIAEIAYGDRGEPLSMTRASGVAEAWAYDGRLRLSHRTVTNGQELLEDLAFERDRFGEITALTEAAPLPTGFRAIDASFAYDAWHRLVGADYIGGDTTESQTRAYDTRDNVLSIASSMGETSAAHVGDLAYDGARPNAVTRARGVTYAYDAAGQMVQRGDLAFTWDHLGRLTEATRGGGSVARFSYGAGMSRVARIEGDAITIYANDDYELRDGIGVAYPRASRQRVARLESAVLAPVLLGDPAPLDGPDGVVNAADAWIAHAATAGLVSSSAIAADPRALVRSAARRLLLESGDGTAALHSDHLGSLDLATDATGAERGRRHYVVPAGETATSGYVDEYGFSGQEEIASLGLVRYEHRWLDPLTMRWTQPDPAFEQATGLSSRRAGELTDRYGYVGNDLANATDPTGLMLSQLRGLFGGGTPAATPSTAAVPATTGQGNGAAPAVATGTTAAPPSRWEQVVQMGQQAFAAAQTAAIHGVYGLGGGFLAATALHPYANVPGHDPAVNGTVATGEHNTVNDLMAQHAPTIIGLTTGFFALAGPRIRDHIPTLAGIRRALRGSGGPTEEHDEENPAPKNKGD